MNNNIQNNVYGTEKNEFSFEFYSESINSKLSNQLYAVYLLYN